MLAFLIAAHLAGDFLLQTAWMAENKRRSSLACAAHVLAYGIPFYCLAMGGVVPWDGVAAVLAQHWVQDRFGVHLMWMRLMNQTQKKDWPVGPLCVDQAMHVAFLALVALAF